MYYHLWGVTSGAGSITGSLANDMALDGTSSGAGSWSSSSPPITHWAHAPLAGTASFEGSEPLHSLFFTGMSFGSGSLSDELLFPTIGIAHGSGSVTASFVRGVGLVGTLSGQSAFNISIPEPLYGQGSLAGFMQVLRVPPPFCQPRCCCELHECDDCEFWHREHHFRFCRDWQSCRDCQVRHEQFHRFDKRNYFAQCIWTLEPNVGRLPEFRWLRTLGRGDLEILLTDRGGNPRGPVFIGYTMYMVSTTGIKHRVGPQDRAPANVSVGRYYVTGTAGENGQPGCWAVVWRYQKTYSEPSVEKLVQFRVVDAVLAGDRHGNEKMRRHCKYGWDI